MSRVQALKAVLFAPSSAPEKSAAVDVPEPGAIADLVVWSVPVVNHSLLICHVEGQDGSNPMNLVNVAVRDNKNFLKNMAVKARHISGKKYALEGPCPRWRGKW